MNLYPRFRRNAFAAAVSAALLSLPLPAATPVGGEFRIDGEPRTNKLSPRVVMSPAGSFAVVWSGNSSDTDTNGVAAHVYAPDGMALGAPFPVNTYTVGIQGNAAAAMSPSGLLVVVVWDSQNQDLSSQGVYARLFDNGLTQTPLGGEIAVNAYTTGVQRNPEVAVDDSGNFVVVWESDGQDQSGYGVIAQRFGTDGAARGAEFVVNTRTTGAQLAPAVASDGNGSFVVTWAGAGEAGPSSEIFAQRYAANGSRLGQEFRVNTTTTGEQGNPAIAMDVLGRFTIVWESGGTVLVQRYSADGLPSGGEFSASSQSSSGASRPSIATDASGALVISWDRLPSTETSQDIFARRFSAEGTPISADFRVNSRTTAQQTNASVALDADGDLIVVWRDQDFNGSTSRIIRGRRFRGTEPVDLSVDQTDNRDPASTGEDVEYRLVASNLHPIMEPTGFPLTDLRIGQATTVRLNITPPADGTVVQAPSGAFWACQGTGIYQCRLSAPMTSGEAAPPLTYIWRPAPTSTRSLISIVEVSHDQLDPLATNNRDRETTRLTCALDEIVFGAVSYPVNEIEPSVEFAVSRNGLGCGAARVQIDTQSGSATAGLDFTDVAGVLDWAPGETGIKTFTVPLLNDGLDENNEAIALRLSAATGAVLAAPSRSRVLIVDDDASPRVNLTGSTASVPETGGLATLTAQLSQVSGRNVDLSFTASGTGTAETDYFLPLAVTIPAGQTATTLQFEVVPDTRDEPDETVNVALSAAAGATVGAISSHRFTIQDDDEPVRPTLSFDITAATGTESENRTAQVRLSEASSATITVDVQVGGNAIRDVDYRFGLDVPPTLSFAPGETLKQIRTEPVNDTLDEAAVETVVLTLANAVGADLGAIPQHTREITDDDEPLTVGFALTAADGTESENRNAVVQLSRADAAAVSVSYGVGGTALRGTDYALQVNPPPNISFAPGETAKTIRTAPINDTLDEPTESIVLTLMDPVGPGLSLGPKSVYTRNIQDDDPSPSVSFASAATSGDESQQTTVMLSLSAASGAEVQVPYSLGGDAASPGDYSVTPASPVRFAPGATTATLSITPVDDNADEADEPAILSLGTPVNATLGALTQHTRTIVDNDEPSTSSITVAFTTAATSSAEGGTRAATLQLSGPSVEPIDVEYETSGTALGGFASSFGTDYSFLSNPPAFVRFNPGETVKDIRTRALNDNIDEPDETLVLTLRGAVGASLGAQSVHTRTIVDITPTPTVTLQGASSALEDSSGGSSVLLSHPSAFEILIPYSLSGSASATDYRVSLPSPIRFEPDSPSLERQFIVTAINDSLEEPDETVVMTLGTPTNATIGAGNVYTHTIIDGDSDLASVAGEEHVNQLETYRQNTPAVASDSGGNYVVAWNVESFDVRGGQRIYLRMFNADGTPATNAILNPPAPDEIYVPNPGGPPVFSFDVRELYPALSRASDGRTILIWSDTLDGRVQGRIYHPDGRHATGELNLSPVELRSGFQPADVASNGIGEFVLAYAAAVTGTTTDIRVRRYDRDGVQIGPFITVNAVSSGHHSEPRIAVGPDGGFVVIYLDNSGRDGNGDGLYAQRFDRDGGRVGPELLVNANVNDNLDHADVAFNSTGNALVLFSLGQSASVTGQLIDAQGVRIGGNFVIGNGTFPRVATSIDDGYAATWFQAGGPRLRALNADGTPRGPVRTVYTSPAPAGAPQNFPDIAPSAQYGGVFGNIVVWDGAYETGTTADNFNNIGIYSQRYGMAP